MPTVPDSPQAAAFRRQVLSPTKLKLFMLRKLPMAWLAGLRLTALTPEAATVTIRFKYLTQNPFRSIYFACLAMAAELASGIQAMMHVQAGGPVSMLVTSIQGDFTKKAVGLIRFTCPDGPQIAQAVPRAALPARAVPWCVPAPAWTTSATWWPCSALPGPLGPGSST